LIPICTKVIVFSQENEAYFVQINLVIVIVVQKNHNETHVHNEQKGSFKGKAELLINQKFMPFEVTHPSE
jgi:hypothetical protein